MPYYELLILNHFIVLYKLQKITELVSINSCPELISGENSAKTLLAKIKAEKMENKHGKYIK